MTAPTLPRAPSYLSLTALGAALALGCGDSNTGTGGAGTSSTTVGATSTTTTSASSTTTASQSSSTGSGQGGQGGAGDPSCATTGKNLLLCDDFEAQAVGDAPDANLWTVEKGTGATVTVDDAQKRFGLHALHLHTLPASNKALMHETKTFPLPGGTNSFYGRAYFMLGTGLAIPTNHTNFFEASGKVGNGTGNYRYGSSNGHFLANYNPGDPTKSSATKVPINGTWSCFEWAFLGDTNELHFYLDGTELTDIAVPPQGVNGTVWTAPNFSSFYFGWITYAMDTASDHYDIWYDNIALDTARIGCAK